MIERKKSCPDFRYILDNTLTHQVNAPLHIKKKKLLLTMNFTQSISHCFNNYANFNGRASRSEFWWFFLFVTILEFAADIWDFIVGYGETGLYIWIIVAATIVPSLSVGARRLHDLNKSGWLQLLAITIIGFIPLIIWWATEGTKKNNPHGKPIKIKK